MEREEGREARGSTRIRIAGEQRAGHQIVHGLPLMAQPGWAVKSGPGDQLADGLWAEAMSAASRSGTKALYFPALSFCAMGSLGPCVRLFVPTALLGAPCLDGEPEGSGRESIKVSPLHLFKNFYLCY